MSRPARTRRTAAVVLAALGAGTALVVTGAAPAAAAETYPRPASGVFPVVGHGWGHGRGMSQWGAQGAATLNVPADAITAAYYPGTARTVLPASSVRVRISADEGRDTTVFAAAGLTVTDLASGRRAVLPAGPTRWRATTDASGLHLSSLTGSTWTPSGVAGAATFAGPLRFSGPTFVRLALPGGASRDYRGGVQAVRTGASALLTVDVLSLEDYLLGVVPKEALSSWSPAALEAQAIAARSYSAYKRNEVKAGAGYDICDTTMCQVFLGAASYSASGTRTSQELATTTAAVRATAGVVRTYGGKPIFAEFSSSNGGWSTAGYAPYLAARVDPWDGVAPNSVHSWTGSLSAADLERRFPAVGRLTRIDVTGRDGNGEWGGRVKAVVLRGVSPSGAATAVTTTGAGVYSARTWPGVANGLRSTWWQLATPTSVPAASPEAVVAPTTTSGVYSVTAPLRLTVPTAPTATFTALLRNTGTTSWPVPGLHLAQAAPVGAADALAGGSTRPGRFVRNRTHPGATRVLPGDLVELAVPFDATRVAAGTYARTYRLRVGTAAPFGALVTTKVAVTRTSVAGTAVAGPLSAYVGVTLRLGSRGAAVTALQKALHVTADGSFGSGTKATVVAFQRAHRLTADGVVGRATWLALGA